MQSASFSKYPRTETGAIIILTKDLMRPGIFKKGSQAIVVEREDTNQMHSSVDKLKAAGFKIPVFIEHPSRKEELAFPIKASDPDAIQRAEDDPYFSGWLESATIDANSMIKVNLDVPDHLGKRLAKTGTYVSPQFGRWKSPDGTVYENSIHHIALTRNPVNPHQSSDFIPKNSKSGVDDGSGSGGNSEPLQMSKLSDAFDDDGVVRFSLGSSMVSPQQQTPNTTDPNAQGNADILSRFQQAMQALGIQIDPNSPIVKDAETMGRVLSMLISYTSDANEKMGRCATPGSGTAPNQSPAEQATVIAMSQNTNTQAQNPPAAPPAAPVQQDDRIVQMSGTILAQQAVIDRLMGIATNSQKAAYNNRIDALVKSGRCTQVKAEALKGMVNTYQFSKDSDPNAKSELDIVLSTIEEFPEGSILSMDDRSKNLHQFGITETQINGGVSDFFKTNEVADDRVNEIMKEYGPKLESVLGPQN